MVRHRNPPSQTWKTFLRNHVNDLVSTDYFVNPTASFRLLFVFIVLSHDRRRPVHFGVTAHPTAEWTAHQPIEAFPWDEAQRCLLRDRDGSYGELFPNTADVMGIEEVLTAPSPWQTFSCLVFASLASQSHGIRPANVWFEPGFWRSTLLR
jgi:putative transposase